MITLYTTDTTGDCVTSTLVIVKPFPQIWEMEKTGRYYELTAQINGGSLKKWSSDTATDLWLQLADNLDDDTAEFMRQVVDLDTKDTK